jgi:hypothetical protein
MMHDVDNDIQIKLYICINISETKGNQANYESSCLKLIYCFDMF